jgi:hypothetical protein
MLWGYLVSNNKIMGSGSSFCDSNLSSHFLLEPTQKLNIGISCFFFLLDPDPKSESWKNTLDQKKKNSLSRQVDFFTKKIDK